MSLEFWYVYIRIPPSSDIDRTLGLMKMEAHMYEARALPHYESLYQNNKDDPFMKVDRTYACVILSHFHKI